MKSAKKGAVTTTYTYNALGQRIMKSTPARTTHYVFDHNGQILIEADGSGATIVEYAYLDQHPLALWRDPPLPGPHDDSDNDGLTNAQEAALGSNPNSSDTDNDGMSDADEARFQLSITTDDSGLDADGDGVSNLNELIAGTNPSDHLAKAAAGAIVPALKILFSN